MTHFKITTTAAVIPSSPHKGLSISHRSYSLKPRGRRPLSDCRVKSICSSHLGLTLPFPEPLSRLFPRSLAAPQGAATRGRRSPVYPKILLLRPSGTGNFAFRGLPSLSNTQIIHGSSSQAVWHSQGAFETKDVTPSEKWNKQKRGVGGERRDTSAAPEN